MAKEPEDEREPGKQARFKRLGAAWIAIGAGVGAALGAALGNIAIGAAIGAGVGAALMAPTSIQRNRD